MRPMEKPKFLGSEVGFGVLKAMNDPEPYRPRPRPQQSLPQYMAQSRWPLVLNFVVPVLPEHNELVQPSMRKFCLKRHKFREVIGAPIKTSRPE